MYVLYDCCLRTATKVVMAGELVPFTNPRKSYVTCMPLDSKHQAPLIQ